MQIFGKIFFVLFFPICLIALPDQNRVQKAQEAKQYESWVVTDKTGKTVLIEGEAISKNSKILASSLNDLGNMYADELSKHINNSEESPFLGWLEIKSVNLCSSKSLRNRLYDEYVRRIQSFLEPGCKDIAYIFIVSDISEEKKILLGHTMIAVRNERNSLSFFPAILRSDARGRGLEDIVNNKEFELVTISWFSNSLKN